MSLDKMDRNKLIRLLGKEVEELVNLLEKYKELPEKKSFSFKIEGVVTIDKPEPGNYSTSFDVDANFTEGPPELIGSTISCEVEDWFDDNFECVWQEAYNINSDIESYNHLDNFDDILETIND